MRGSLSLLTPVPSVADRPNGATDVRVNGATHGCCSGVSEGVIISLFFLLRQRLVFGARAWGPGRAIALALESQAVGAVSEPVEGSGAEQSVGEGVAPLREVEVDV